VVSAASLWRIGAHFKRDDCTTPGMTTFSMKLPIAGFALN
jgi:hypothetical protein